MTDPRILSIFMVVFILLGTYNIFSGLRRLREARARGQKVTWYRQINLLTGIEFLLLSIVFILSLNFNALPNSLKAIAVPFYLVVLLLSAVMAGFVIRQAVLNARNLSKNRAAPAIRNGDSSRVSEPEENALTPEERAANLQRRRERRQKAAAARRRRAGKA